MWIGMTIGIVMGSIVVTLAISCLCGVICCGVRKRRNMHNNTTFPNPPVVVTSTTHTAPGGYPITQVPPPSGYQQQPMYPPYPTPAGAPGQMPMPMPMPGAQSPMSGVQPYPPAVPATTYNPPSYDAAVAGVGVAQPNNSFEKQAPYNPNYNAY
ncbi:protein shisa-5 isoform X3 [Zeugodacus cucurbitae]|uniref:protein shisa-5 isoform X3 n=1 Tax=Zeugodacus cucurbitae TaxID=28588 RepID=UPI0010A748ED|nr:protein shisa-5 isoform X3 [Zeugodacus cucurbitae]